MPTEPTPIEPIADYPVLGDPDFADKAANWVADQSARVVPEMNALAENVYANAQEIAAANPTYVQDTEPAGPGPYVWWDTSGGNLSLWIEDGE